MPPRSFVLPAVDFRRESWEGRRVFRPSASPSPPYILQVLGEDVVVVDEDESGAFRLFDFRDGVVGVALGVGRDIDGSRRVHAGRQQGLDLLLEIPKGTGGSGESEKAMMRQLALDIDGVQLEFVGAARRELGREVVFQPFLRTYPNETLGV